MATAKKVVVTTKHRGVFCGTTTAPNADPLKLKDARMAVYWSKDVKGVPGLAAKGPTAGCRISPAAPLLTIPKNDVTAVFDCSDEASSAWEREPWS